MRRIAISATLCLAAVGSAAAFADDQIYKCLDQNGVMMLTDKPCDAAPAPDGQAALEEIPAVTPAVAPQRLVVKEHYTLPPAEYGRGSWTRKPPVTTPPKVDVATLKAARLNLELSEKTASLR